MLELFAGSGTTLMVAKELGRDALGIELNPAHLPPINTRCGIVDAARTDGACRR